LSVNSPQLLFGRLFSARQHIAARYAIARPSGRLSATRVDHTTRSQAVARIADRTAKNCRGHVT